MTEKWTPGPWRHSGPDRNGDTMIIRNADSNHHWYCVAHGVQSKNANLIAAAPDLYTTLEALITSRGFSLELSHNRTHEALELREQAIKVLNKAREEG